LNADTVLDVDAHPDWLTAAAATPETEKPDLVVEATGRPEVWEQALALPRKGGVLNLFGGPPKGTQASFDTQRLHYAQIQLVSPFHHTPWAFQEALALLASGAIAANVFITEARPLTELPALLKEMLTRKDAVKTRIVPGS
jgi:L-iditol 2-dehydrogenase